MLSHSPVPDLSDPPRAATDDLSALAWVHEELRRSLDAAHKALRRYLRDAQALDGSDVDAVDPAVLRGARIPLHQGAGALELVGLPTPALVLRAAEAAVQRGIAKPVTMTPALVQHVERASFALLDYLTRLLAGKHVSPLQLFPSYRALQEAAAAERVHPADLWPHDWKWRALPAEAGATPRAVDAATRLALEGQLLELMRGGQPQATAARMSDICAGLGAGAGAPETATFWKLAAAVFEAQAQGLLGFDVFSKRVASRLLAQFRVLERGDAEVSPRLAQDLLFFCAQSASPGDGRAAPRLSAVRQAYALAHDAPVDYASSVLGRYDPAWIAQARKRVAAAKESWSALAGGEAGRLPGLTEQFALVGESLKRLFPHGEAFAAELQHTVAALAHVGVAPTPELAMEVATCLLYVEASLEDADFDHPQQAPRVLRLIERLHAARHGHAAEPLEGWAEELYRRVSDRQTMGSVVQELRAALSEVERHIDQFFRKPAEHAILIPVPVQMSTMRGVLSVLGMDHAAAALLHMRDEVERLVTADVDPQKVLASGLFDRLAGNLGALGFLIDMLSVQPQMAKSLFAFDPASGSFGPVMGRDPVDALIAPPAPDAIQSVEPRLIEQAQLLAFAAMRDDVSLREVETELAHLGREAHAAGQPALAAAVMHAQEAIDHAGDAALLRDARSELSEALVDFVHTASKPIGLDLVPPGAAAAASVPADAPDHDAEMREVFLEEAREVLHDARGAHAALGHSPTDITLLTTLRRAFHTLKGSSRMVGLDEFGAAAWVCEQYFNTQLAEQRGLDPAGLAFTVWALDYLTPWVEAIAQGEPSGRDAATVDAAQPGAAAPAAIAVAEVSEGIDLEALGGLESFAAMPVYAAPGPHAGSRAPAATSSDFLLDLSGLDATSTDLPEARAAWVDDPLPSAIAAERAPAFDAEVFDAQAFDAEKTQVFDAERTQVFDAERTQVYERLPEPEDLSDVAAFGSPSGLIELDFEPRPASVVEPAAAVAAPPTADSAEPADAPDDVEEDPFKRVGPLRIGIALFNIFLNEADELSRKLGIETAEWALETHRPVSEHAIALAHSLAGNSATVGFADLSSLARQLESALTRSRRIGHGTPAEAQLFVDIADEVRRLLHQFAAGFLKDVPPSLLHRLAAHEVECAVRLADSASAADRPAALDDALPALGATAEADLDLGFDAPDPVPVGFDMDRPVTDTGRDVLPAQRQGAAHPPLVESVFGAFGLDELRPLPVPSAQPRHAVTGSGDDADFDAVDAVDAELFPIFEEEALELLPRLAADLRAWSRLPDQPAHADACMRTLHTLKGGARLAGAMRLGELAHRLEAGIEHVLARAPVEPDAIEWLQAQCDAIEHNFDRLRAGASGDAAAAEAQPPAPLAAAPNPGWIEPEAVVEPALETVPVEPPDTEPQVRLGRPVEASAFD
ncbi:MAG: Hpt domain-containing protein, partial [Burkholderiaceae bacterium]